MENAFEEGALLPTDSAQEALESVIAQAIVANADYIWPEEEEMPMVERQIEVSARAAWGYFINCLIESRNLDNQA